MRKCFSGSSKKKPGCYAPMLLLLPSHLSNQTSLLGSKLGTDNRARKDMARPQPTSRNRLRVQSSINDIL